MKTNDSRLRALGVAFLLQFVTSLFSGAVLSSALFVPGDISATMIQVATNVGLMRATILVDVLTALGIIFLGAMLFLTLRKGDERIALVGLSFYIFEAVLLGASKVSAFSLLRMSQEYAVAGQPEYLQTLGLVALESMDFVGVTLHMLAFCLGAILFYYLLYRSDVVPNALSLWGLVTVSMLLIFTLFDVFGYAVPFFLYLPYVPFELVIGLWLLVEGIRGRAPTRTVVPEGR